MKGTDYRIEQLEALLSQEAELREYIKELRDRAKNISNIVNPSNSTPEAYAGNKARAEIYYLHADRLEAIIRSHEYRGAM